MLKKRLTALASAITMALSSSSMMAYAETTECKTSLDDYSYIGTVVEYSPLDSEIRNNGMLHFWSYSIMKDMKAYVNDRATEFIVVSDGSSNRILFKAAKGVTRKQLEAALFQLEDHEDTEGFSPDPSGRGLMSYCFEVEDISEGTYEIFDERGNKLSPKRCKQICETLKGYGLITDCVFQKEVVYYTHYTTENLFVRPKNADNFDFMKKWADGYEAEIVESKNGEYFNLEFSDKYTGTEILEVAEKRDICFVNFDRYTELASIGEEYNLYDECDIEFGSGDQEVLREKLEQRKRIDDIYVNMDSYIFTEKGTFSIEEFDEKIESGLFEMSDYIIIGSAINGKVMTVAQYIEYCEGDANCDDSTTIADAVAVLQNLANSSKYPITEQGVINADFDGDGLTALDALEIQKMDATKTIS